MVHRLGITPETQKAELSAQSQSQTRTPDHVCIGGDDSRVSNDLVNGRAYNLMHSASCGHGSLRRNVEGSMGRHDFIEDCRFILSEPNLVMSHGAPGHDFLNKEKPWWKVLEFFDRLQSVGLAGALASLAFLVVRTGKAGSRTLKYTVLKQLNGNISPSPKESGERLCRNLRLLLIFPGFVWMPLNDQAAWSWCRHLIRSLPIAPRLHLASSRVSLSTT